MPDTDEWLITVTNPSRPSPVGNSGTPAAASARHVSITVSVSAIRTQRGPPRIAWRRASTALIGGASPCTGSRALNTRFQRCACSAVSACTGSCREPTSSNNSDMPTASTGRYAAHCSTGARAAPWAACHGANPTTNPTTISTTRRGCFVWRISVRCSERPVRSNADACQSRSPRPHRTNLRRSWEPPMRSVPETPGSTRLWRDHAESNPARKRPAN